MMRIIILLFLLLLINPSYAENSLYDLDLPPELMLGAKDRAIKGMSSEINVSKKATPKANIAMPQTTKKKGLSKFFSKKNKPAFDDESGYKGTLPSIKSEFKYKAKHDIPIDKKGDSPDNYTPEEFQKSKIDDPLFLDVILDKEKPSSYIKDMLQVMHFLETFRKVIENNSDIQRFNANVNLLDLYARRIEKLYSEKPEGMSPSYYQLLDLAYKAKVLGNLKYDANYYSKFSPITGTKYEAQNIKKEEEKLLVDLDKTVFLIRQLDN